MSIFDRRNFLKGVGATSLLTSFPVHADELPLDGLIDGVPKAQKFQNMVLLGADGKKREGWGAEITEEGKFRCGPQIKGGLDLKGSWLVPGVIDAGCTVGMWEVDLESGTHDDNESSSSINTDVRAYDGYNTMSAVIPTVRANGTTTVVVHPSLSRLGPGHAAALHTVGLHKRKALVDLKERPFHTAGFCICLGGAAKGGDGPSTRMGIAARLREIFKENTPSPEPEKCYFFCDDPVDPYVGLSAEEMTWRLVRDRKIPLLIKADRLDDIMFALNLIDEFDVNGVLVGAAEAWLASKEIAEAGVPLLLGPTTVQPSSFEHLHAREDAPALLQKAGVRFALRSGSNHFARTLLTKAAVAVAHGLDHQYAIQSLCGSASDILGLGLKPILSKKREFHDATFFISDGDPLQARNSVQRMWIRGLEADLRTKQTLLYEKYRTL